MFLHEKAKNLPYIHDMGGGGGGGGVNTGGIPGKNL